jgi:hypothetical protein
VQKHKELCTRRTATFWKKHGSSKRSWTLWWLLWQAQLPQLINKGFIHETQLAYSAIFRL